MLLGSGLLESIKDAGILATSTESKFYVLEEISKADPKDTDKDGIDDVKELENKVTDPLNGNDANLDFDEDGFSNLQEIVIFKTSASTANTSMKPPELKGLSLQAAKKMLHLYGLQIGALTFQSTVHKPAVGVILSSVSPHSPIPSGSSVDLTVSLPVDSNRFISQLNLTRFDGSAANTVAYYHAIDPFGQKLTLDNWISANGYGNGGAVEAFAAYFNEADLGFGRRMFMRNNGDVVSYYVINYLNADDAAEGNPDKEIATVAMEYSAHPVEEGAPYVKFYTYNGRGAARYNKDKGAGERILKIDLDGAGDKFQPGMCMTCHGGTPQELDSQGKYPNLGNVGARFIPFDVHSFTYPTAGEYSRANQEVAFKKLNQGVLDSIPEGQLDNSDAVVELIRGWYGGSGLPRATADDSYIPDGWKTADSTAEGGPKIYTDVVAKSCRACHIMQTDRKPSLDFASYVKFKSYNQRIRSTVFNEAYMPMAKRTYDKFWLETDPNQAEVLACWLDAAGKFTSPEGVSDIIPDFGQGAVLESEIDVTTSISSITDIDLSIDRVGPPSITEGDSNNGLNHSYVGDLRITLVSPGNTSVVLMNQSGGGGNNICDLRFDDEVNNSIDGVLSSQAPFIGSWKPHRPLAAFDGENPNGTWKLRIEDMAPGDTGSLQQWSLHINSTGKTIGPGRPVAKFTASSSETPIFREVVSLDAQNELFPDQKSLFADSYSWTLQRPNGSSAVIDDPSSEATSFQVESPGVFIVTLTVGNSFGKSVLSKTFTVTNQAPTVTIPSTMQARYPLPIDVDATITDDGLPIIAQRPRHTYWEKLEGPGDVTFTPVSQFVKEDVTITFARPGIYVLRLNSSDASGLYGSATMVVTVEAEIVVVDAAGNPAHPLTGMGSVGYDFMMGKYEVNNREYAAFLNAVAATDPYGLYNGQMEIHAQGGITRSGNPGDYTYNVKSGFLLKPVNFVSFFDAVRFVNWLQNGAKPGADTESGAYDLQGGTAIPSNASTVTRNANIDFWIPNEDEWYKAAFYHPSVQGGDSDSYWEYATGSNQVPSAVLPPSPPPAANYRGSRAHEDTEITVMGSYTGSSNFFGTYDQNGNVWEVTDNITFVDGLGDGRGGTGGGYWNTSVTSSSNNAPGQFWGIDWESAAYGFRIAGSINLKSAGTVDAGADIAVTPPSYPHTLQLSGTVVSGLTSTWQRISGPSSASINDSGDPNTTVTFQEVGDYVFELKGSDNFTDTVRVSILISFSGEIVPIFSSMAGAANCIQCHNQSNPLNLSTANGNNVYDSITGSAARAVPGQPGESLIVLKPTLGIPYGKTISHGGGDRTIAAPPLTQNHIKALELWINQGVKEN